MNAVYIVLVTAPTKEIATAMAKELVEKKLVACINIIPGVSSVYFWEGQIQEESEVLMFMKSTRERKAELQDAVKKLHPYQTPEFIVISPESIEPTYERWVFDCCKSR